MVGGDDQVPSPPQRSLNQIFYLPRSTSPSHFQNPKLGKDALFAFSLQYMLPKFFTDRDAYLSITKFE